MNNITLSGRISPRIKSYKIKRVYFTCPEIRNFANILSEMKKILIFCAFLISCVNGAGAAVRDGNATTRAKSDAAPTQQRISTTVKSNRTSSQARTSVLAPVSVTARGDSAKTTTGRTTSARGATIPTVSARTATPARSAVSPRTQAGSSRKMTPIISRAATETTSTAISQTRTGAEYENCKAAYFACMDQFCQLKNDDYRRCSCSNRVNELAEVRDVIQQAGEQLTVFTENLDVVGMTAAQAAAMRTASEGENALTSDTSASKALLQAIMNSIRGEDSNVGGKYSDLNSINLSFDTANAFGAADSGQIIATYNAQNLYNAVYPQCRNAVRNDCNDASLQRAINAYLMAIEQDCNTVQTAIEEKQKQMKSAVREGSAMLDLARVENRQKHNSDDIATCLNNVEAAVLSEEVCGAGYHKCLDNGEFIDISTGAPIAGVVKFYELGNLLTFSDGVSASDQKLSKIPNNRTFIQNFEKRVKKFAEPALDKCTEQADVVWAEYLDKAMLDIYYAQKAKVAEIKQGCFDFVSSCYMNGEAALTAAMKELTGDSGVVVQPAKVALSTKMCTGYVESCNNMFDGNIIQDYIANRQDTDTLTACRAVAKQCFDKFGGTSYENFYYPYSGLFTSEHAPDWFSLYEITNDGNNYDVALGEDVNGNKIYGKYKSECAKQLAKIDACNSREMMEKAFGGFDVMPTLSAIRQSANSTASNQNDIIYYLAYENEKPEDPKETPKHRYGQLANLYHDNTITKSGNTTIIDNTGLKAHVLAQRNLRPTGVATEIYNQVVDILTTQCTNLQGRFIEYQFVKPSLYNPDSFCQSKFGSNGETEYSGAQIGQNKNFVKLYGIGKNEDMCPRDYNLGVDTQSWGACLCWENGARRSKWGTSAKCMAVLPVQEEIATEDVNCIDKDGNYPYTTAASNGTETNKNQWCIQGVLSDNKQVCPMGWNVSKETGYCTKKIDDKTIIELGTLPKAITY